MCETSFTPIWLFAVSTAYGFFPFMVVFCVVLLFACFGLLWLVGGRVRSGDALPGSATWCGNPGGASFAFLFSVLRSCCVCVCVCAER